ncbi:flagellar export protein FliJ [Chitinibacter bivalviorum]|uniref:Flagellar FliJ protein n=1 Tax=Chitinibacter bivalviorum TaxID=2739434 RepID=A0A7H9BJA4_9NEIS|nr:flagellar export protein FliJ [Chitinibacter bivalviorum]QLG88081.1 flagellar export protein FliJ [Chitinibacter bivalviorum]
MAAFRFAFLLQLALDEREEASRAMQAAQASWLLAKSKLEQVDGFRTEYRARLANQAQTGISITQWRDFQLFLAKLDAAAIQQNDEVVRLGHEYERRKIDWQDCERKVKAFEALKDRHEKGEIKKENQREQKMLDEFNSRFGRES